MYRCTGQICSVPDESTFLAPAALFFACLTSVHSAWLYRYNCTWYTCLLHASSQEATIRHLLLATSGSYDDQPSSALSDEDTFLQDEMEDSFITDGEEEEDEDEESGVLGGTKAAAGQQERQGVVAWSPLRGGRDAAVDVAGGQQRVDSGAVASEHLSTPAGPAAAAGPAADAAGAAGRTKADVPIGTEVGAVRCRATALNGRFVGLRICRGMADPCWRVAWAPCKTKARAHAVHRLCSVHGCE